ncbi:hypothetical protein [Streptomyces coeruleorubidus]
MPSPVTWSDDERRRFVDDGVLIRRGLVHGAVLSKARALVGGWLAEAYDPARLTAYTERSFAPELEEHPTSSPCTGEAAWRSWPETCCGPRGPPRSPGRRSRSGFRTARSSP